MRIVVAVGLASLLAACSDESSGGSEIGWQLDYRDFTDDQAVEDIRDCSNAPSNDPEVPYDPISTVRVSVQDPAQQVPGIDQEVDCARGEGGSRFELVGLVRQSYELVLEAKTAAGVVLYRYRDPDFDLSSEVITTVVMPTVTGEIAFTPVYAGRPDYTCPAAEPSTLRYTLYMKDDTGAIGSEPVLAGTQSAVCADDGFGNRQAKELVIRQLPTNVQEGTRPYVELRAVIEALDAGGDAMHCVDLDGSDASHRLLAVRPGRSRLTSSSDPTMDPGDCP
jgi:hypothetical protein